MRWFRENTDLIAIAVVALAVTAGPPVPRVRLGALTGQRVVAAEIRQAHHEKLAVAAEIRQALNKRCVVAAEIRQALRDARGEIRRTLRTSTALHRYND
jgi:hypothetical protein